MARRVVRLGHVIGYLVGWFQAGYEAGRARAGDAPARQVKIPAQR